MRNLRMLTFVIILSAMLSGCISVYDNIKSVDSDVSPAMALLVGSVTQTSDGNPTPWHEKAMFFFRQVDGRIKFRLESAEIERPFFGQNRALADTGLQPVNGKLFAVQVPPGTYRLVYFGVNSTSGQHIEFRNPVEFEVLAGEIVYLGNLDAGFCVRHVYANQYSVVGVTLSVKDRFDRDITLLQDKYIWIRKRQIAKRILDSSVIERQSESLRRRCTCDRNCI